ncbi:MAG: NAD(P)-dependent oxidoreductase [Thermoplasmata archaeon]|nr:NAD(P)-dependent oxidoreductase [Thermoplasmata archaeon]
MDVGASPGGGSAGSRGVVGFVGLGMMGSRVAGTLLAKGVPLIVHNRDRTKAEPLLARGAIWANRPGQVGRGASAGVVFLMLTDGRAVARVLFGRGGLAAGLAEGSSIVDLSTIAPEESRKFATRLGKRGVAYLDAPVGGSIGPAERGELVIFAGGDTVPLDRVQPLLEKISRRVERMGPVGSGTSMKLVNNLLTVGTIGLVSEAVSLGEAFGLDRSRLISLLRVGGGASAMLEAKHANLETRTYPPAFLLPHARKDLKLVERAARRAGRPAGLAREARRMYDEALALGHEREDFSSVFEAARLRSAPARRPRSSPVSPDGSGTPAPG